MVASKSEKNMLNDSRFNEISSGRIYGRYYANEKEEEQVLRDVVHEVCFSMNSEAINEQ